MFRPLALGATLIQPFATPPTGQPAARSKASATRFLLYLVALAIAALAMRYLAFGAVSGDRRFYRFMAAMCSSDCAFYSDLMKRGYEAVATKSTGLSDSWAFFPLVPLVYGVLTRATSVITEHGAMWLISTTITIATAIAARPLFESDRAAWLFGAYLLLGPLNPILSILYSEPAFLLLTILCLRALQARRYGRAGVWAGLLSATRTTGVLIGLSVFTRFVIDHFQGGGRLLELPLALFRSPNVLVGLALVPTGLLAFMVYLHFHTGDALAFVHAQANWYRVIDWPWRTVLDALSSFWPKNGADLIRISHSIALLAGIGLSIALFATRRFPEAVFCTAVMLVSMSAGLGSMTRFVLGLAPFAILLVDMLSRRSWLYWLSYPVIAAWGIVSAGGWLIERSNLV